MPFYEYECSRCKHCVGEYQKMADAPLKKCPNCLQDKLQRVFSMPNAIVEKEPTNLDQLAEKNSKKFGREECQERELKAKERVAKARKKTEPAGTPLWRNGSIPGLVKKDTPINDQEILKYAKELEAAGATVNMNATPPKTKRKKKNGQAK